MTKPDWNQAKKYMLPYEGGASQIHILKLPKASIRNILSVISKRLKEPAVSLISNQPLDTNIDLYKCIHDKALIEKFLLGQSTISAKIFDTADITFDVWVEKSLNTFDLEVWFWADQIFTGDDSLNLKRFNEIVSIIEEIAEEGTFKCILTPCEAGDPLKNLSAGLGCEIKLKRA